MNLLTQKQFISRDVTFHETIFPFHDNSIPSLMAPVPPSFPNLTQTYCDDWLPSDAEHDTSEDTNEPISDSELSETSQHSPTPVSLPVHSPITSSIPPPVLRKSTRTRAPPAWLKDYEATNLTQQISNLAVTTVEPQFQCFMTSLTQIHDPTYFKVAVQHTNWVNVMALELEALELNKTWTVTELPQNKQAIGCKWIYKTELNHDGTIDKHKAMLVVLGNRQQYGIDYSETFAPVAKLTTVRTLIVMDAMEKWHTCQMDVRNFFLHGDFVRHCLYETSTRIHTHGL